MISLCNNHCLAIPGNRCHLERVISRFITNQWSSDRGTELRWCKNSNSKSVLFIFSLVNHAVAVNLLSGVRIRPNSVSHRWISLF